MASPSTAPCFKRIVVGDDGGPAGRDAVALGARLALAGDGALSLVGVLSSSLFPFHGMTDRRTLRSHAEKVLRADRRRFAPAASLHVLVDRSAPRAITHHALRWSADVVVIGSASKTPIGHVGISSRGRQLVSEAPFALAVAMRGLSERDFRLSKVGVGYDGGRESESALEVAACLARATQSKLSVLTMVENRVPRLSGWQLMELDDWEHVWEPERIEAQRRAEVAAGGLGVSCEVTAAVGDPGHELRRLSSQVDLMVIGSRRWGTLARIMAGSVGETLVADAGCSLLIVPRPTGQRRRTGHLWAVRVNLTNT